MLTPECLREIKERCERATPGPWRWDDTPWGEGKALIAIGRKNKYGLPLTILDDGSAAGEYAPTSATEADRDFIAHAREDVPALVAEVERLQELANDYRLHIEHLATILGCIQTEAEALRRLIHEAKVIGGKARLDDMEKLVQAIFGWLEAKRAEEGGGDANA